MLTTYGHSGTGLVRLDGEHSCPKAVWIDLLNPTREEDSYVESELGIDIPTREEMRDIEVSSRLYHENATHYMTATVVFRIDSPDPLSSEITFILTEKQLVTVRYAEPRGMQMFLAQAGKGDIACRTAPDVVLGLIQALVEREADLIERLQADADRIAQSVFQMKGGAGSRTRRFDVVFKEIGKMGEINSRVRDSLVSIGRLLTYFGSIPQVRADQALHQRVHTETQDVHSLSDHVSYMNSRLTFMLDASLGMVGIEQNQIIKLFSVVAVMLMPPTLVASIYGMNFKQMPELSFEWGYPMALGLMVISAVVPYFYFKRKGWL